MRRRTSVSGRPNSSRSGAFPAWKTRRRVVEDVDDDSGDSRDSTRTKASALSSASQTEFLIQKIQDLVRSPARRCAEQTNLVCSTIVKPCSGQTRNPEQEIKPKRPFPTAAAAFFASQRAAKQPLSVKQENPKIATTSGQSPKDNARDCDDEEWVNDTQIWTGRKSARNATHNGQPGVWHCLMDAPYSSRKEWIFIPDKQTSTMPNPRPRKNRESKGKINFLSLPGELRNEIYRHIIPECRVLIVQTKPNKEMERQKKIWSEEGVSHKRSRSRLGHLLDVGQISEGLGITMNLLLACQQVMNDVELYLYSRTTFCFSSAKVLTKFLDTASKPGLRAIQKVEILHKGYANPELTNHRVYRDRYYSRWSRTCTQVGEELIGLQHLKLEAHLRDWPCELSAQPLNDTWRKACLQMAPRRLLKVEVKLHHIMIHRNTMVLKELAHKLENDMMTLEGQMDRDRAETVQVLLELEAKKATKEAKAKARLARQKPPPELTITEEDIKHQKPTPAKVCTTGLDMYSWVGIGNIG